jgi:ubiquinone/menaquinone biosynthesis C-methylase UbiE
VPLGLFPKLQAGHHTWVNLRGSGRARIGRSETSARYEGALANAKSYDRIARLYDALDFPFEYWRYRPLRREVLGNLSGRILDAGVGTGRNMPFYLKGSELVGIDRSREMLARAARRSRRLDLDVELFHTDVCRTAFPDRHFDAIIATFLFCTLAEHQQLPALKELARICKPTGEIRLLDYGYSKNPFRRFVMRLWAPWVRWAYGAAFDRRPEKYVSDAGLEIVERRYVFRDVIKLLILKPVA